MKEIIQTISLKLGTHENCVDHDIAGGVYMFRVGQSKKRVYIHHELIDNSDWSHLEPIIRSTRLLETLEKGENSCWLYLNSSGMRSVDETFARKNAWQ